MERHKKVTDWPTFLAEQSARFVASLIDNIEGLLSKLTQTSTMLDYEEQFEALSGRVTGFSPTFLLSRFISVLKSSIRYEVEFLQPSFLTMAVRLAYLQEKQITIVQRTTPLLCSASVTPYPFLSCL